MEKFRIDNKNETMGEILSKLIKLNGYSQERYASEFTNTTRQNLGIKLSRDSIRAEEFRNIAESLGYMIELVPVSRGVSMNTNGGASRVYDGVLYDTSNSILEAEKTLDQKSGLKAGLYLDSSKRHFLAVSIGNDFSVIPVRKGSVNSILNLLQ